MKKSTSNKIYSAQDKSFLALGNTAFREGDYAVSAAYYLRALRTTPALSNMIISNFEMAKRKHCNERKKDERRHVAVCGWELSHNAAGRVYTLAKIYETFADVEIIGSIFSSYGREIWEPIRNTNIPLHTFIVEDESHFIEQAMELVVSHPYDVVHLSKPRASNIILGVLYRVIWGAKVLIDIDDEELAFVGAESPISIDDYLKLHDQLPELKNMIGADWTRIAVGLAKEFDGVTVSGPALQQRYGGEIIRHVRDEKLYQPSLALKFKSRAKFGIPQNKKVVLFFGTPREHKGLLETADAIVSMHRNDLVFVIVGDFEGTCLKNKLLNKKEVEYFFIGNQSFDVIPEIVAMGDICVLMQSLESLVSQFQVPAKLSDALGMGLVVIASETLALSDIIKYGAIIPATPETLASSLKFIIENQSIFDSSSRNARLYFEKNLCIKSSVVNIKKLLEKDFLHLEHFHFNRKRLIDLMGRQFGISFIADISSYLSVSVSKLVEPNRLVQPAMSSDLIKEPKPKLKKTVLVITWDVGHNPLGRSYMLAEVLDRVVYNVILVGFQFKRYGTDIWEPLRNGRLPIITLPGDNFPEFLNSLDRISQRIRPDIVIACKPRLPSLQLGVLIKQKFGCPLIVDIDDHELSFFKNDSELGINELAQMTAGSVSDQAEPFGETWTRLAQHMCKYADERIVSNIALQKEFGGMIISHVRDENIFNPALFNKNDSRLKYGVPLQAKVVLFFGTPRHHKGINTLAEAVGLIKDNNFRLVIVGTITDRSVASKIDLLAPGQIIYLPNQPFSAIPEIVIMADVICLPQDEDNSISKFQLPAKAIDAIAMGIPLLVTRTPPLMQLVQDGVAVPIDRENLPEMLKTIVIKTQVNQSEVRSKYLALYSYAAAAKLLRELVERLLRNGPCSPTDDLPLLLAEERRIFGAMPISQSRSSGVDIVVFWKQNDTSLYGRRSDMVIKYLASRPDVRRVIVFDAPISEFDLLKQRDSQNQITQERLIYIKTYEKILGKLDTAKISYNVFVFPSGVYSTIKGDDKKPQLVEAYLEYIKNILIREDVRPEKSVFWIYPKNFMAPKIIDHLSPAKVVVDVVDDHRAWPGISEEEYRRLTDNYRETLACADMAFVNCKPMVATMSEFFPAIRLIPNGCDADRSYIDPINNVDFNAFIEAPGKTIGFVGNLEKKIDISLVAKIAETFSDCKIVLIGSTHANPEVLQLKRYSNVWLPGVVPYDQVGAWISKFDVGIIPHLDLDMTQNMNPLKLYVYLSWHVSVVSTEVFNIDSSSKFVRIARNHDEFLEYIKISLRDGQIDDLSLVQYIKANSWDSRLCVHVDELLGSMKDKTMSS